MTNDHSGNGRWTPLTKALLLGFVGMAVLLHQSFVLGAGFVPTGASQLMLWVTVVGIVGYVALHQDLTLGYWLASFTGILYVAFVGVIMGGVLGPLPSEGPMIGFVLGPIAQVLYAIVLIGASYLALRDRKSETEKVSEERGRQSTSPQ